MVAGKPQGGRGAGFTRAWMARLPPVDLYGALLFQATARL